MPIPTRSASLREPRKPVSLPQIPAFSPAFQLSPNRKAADLQPSTPREYYIFHSKSQTFSPRK